MATYRITTPDGATYDVTAPEGASQADVMSFAQNQHARIAGQIASDPISQGARSFATDGMSTLDKLRAGVGQAYTNVARGAGQLVGAVDRQDISDARRLDAPLDATTAGKVGNVLGNVALMAPAALIPGAATIPGGAAIGAVQGLLQPSTSTRESLTNIGLGGAAGAAVPLVMKGAQLVKAAAEPLYAAGQDNIVGRALNRAAGSDAPAVANRLQEAGTPFIGPSQGVPRTVMGEIVPGSIPTVGQAAENPGVSALERAATAGNPDVTNAISARMAEQNGARTNALAEMAGKGGQREFYAAARDATGSQLYGEARRLGVDPKTLTPEALQNIAAFSKRVPDEVLSKAKQLAQISGEPMTDATSIQGMHWMKMAIDDLIGAADRSGNATLKRAYTGLQKDLLTGMDAMSPAYQNARQTYAAMSKPINQMDVAGAIADKSINPLTGNLQPNAYAKALSDRTAAQATGNASATLESVMEPKQLNALDAILRDVQRSTAAQNVGRGAGSDTVQKLAYTNLLDQSGMPTFVRSFKPAQVAGNLAGRAADAVYGRANREIGNRLAEVMLDPAAAAELMKRVTPTQRNQIEQLLMTGASGLALSAPASANALQH